MKDENLLGGRSKFWALNSIQIYFTVRFVAIAFDYFGLDWMVYDLYFAHRNLRWKL